MLRTYLMGLLRLRPRGGLFIEIAGGRPLRSEVAGTALVRGINNELVEDASSTYLIKGQHGFRVEGGVTGYVGGTRFYVKATGAVVQQTFGPAQERFRTARVVVGWAPFPIK